MNSRESGKGPTELRAEIESRRYRTRRLRSPVPLYHRVAYGPGMQADSELIVLLRNNVETILDALGSVTI